MNRINKFLSLMLIFVVLLTNTAVTYASNDDDIEDDYDKTSIIISGDFIDNYNTVDHELPGEIAIKSINEIFHEDLIKAFNDESLASSEIFSSFDSETLDLLSKKNSGITLTIGGVEFFQGDEIDLSETDFFSSKSTIFGFEAIPDDSSTYESETITDDFNTYESEALPGNPTTNMSSANLPDLAVLIFEKTPPVSTPFVALALSEFNVKVGNIGTAGANMTVGIKFDGVLIHSFGLGYFAPNYTLSFQISLSNVEYGSHYIEVIVDPFNAIQEVTKSNNSILRQYFWDGLPDLTVPSFIVDMNANNVQVGYDIPFRFTIANIGNAPTSRSFFCDIYADGSLLYRFTVPSTKALETYTFTFELVFPAKKDYTLSIFADSTNLILESNEFNNGRSLNVSVKIASTITVSGTFKHYVYDSPFPNDIPYMRNLSGFSIGVSNGVTEYIVQTDANGKFSITIPNTMSANGSDISLHMVMNMDYCRISCYGDQNFLGLSDVYTISTVPITNYQHPELQFGTFVLDGDETLVGIFNIHYWIKMGYDFYRSYGYNVDKINVSWELGGNEDPWYSYTKNYLNLYQIVLGGNIDKSHLTPAVILHEYGHHIMYASGLNPNDVSTEHSMGEPCVGKGTAFMEGFAHFFSAKVRNIPILLSYHNGQIYGGDLQQLTYTEDNSTITLSRQPQFHLNAYMELFAGAALYALSNFYGTQKVLDVVNIKAHQHTIDFYNSFIVSVSTKYDAWNIFNQKHVAFDYNLPNVNMYETAKGEFTAYFSDDIWINRVEWLVSGVTQKVSTAPQSSDKFIMPVHLANSNQTVEIKVYDFEGAIRGSVIRMDIDLNIRRTQAYNNVIVNYKP